MMNAIFYSLAFGGSEIAPLQLIQSLVSIRRFDKKISVFVFLFGDVPKQFFSAINQYNVNIRHLGIYSEYVSQIQPDRSNLFTLDPKIHRWLILEEPELKLCSRLLYVDSDTVFLAPPSVLFEKYQGADFYAREEPFCRRSAIGYNSAYLDEDNLDKLRQHESLNRVPPFNTGVCLFSRKMADGITRAVPRYFDNLYRFLSWFYLNPTNEASLGNTSINAIHDPNFKPDVDRAMMYPSKNRWIVDQVAMWLALGQYDEYHYGDLQSSDVWQGAEFQTNRKYDNYPIICHYFSSNTSQFFQWLQKLQPAHLQR